MPLVHLLRHGHVHNPDKVLYGRLDGFRLSSTGEQMAQAVADYLDRERHDVGQVIASPLLRAQQTAAPIAAAFALEVGTEERIIEAGNLYEGEPLPSSVRDFVHPKHWWRLRNPLRPSWGEPYRDLRERMWAAMADAARACPDRETVMVSHQLPIWSTRLDYENRRVLHDPRSRQCGLASLTTYHLVDGVAVDMEYREPAAHIEVNP